MKQKINSLHKHAARGLTLRTAILGCLALTTSYAVAQVEFTENLGVALTAQMPGETVEVTRGRGDNEETIGMKTLKPRTVKVNNKALLKLLAAPANSKLVLVNGAIATQHGKDAPVTTAYTIAVEEPNVIISQGQETKIDSSTDEKTKIKRKSVYSSRFVTKVSLAGDGVSFDLTGLASESDKSSSVETNDEKTSRDSDSFSINGAGNGSVTDGEDTFDALFSGKITTSGKGVLIE